MRFRVVIEYEPYNKDGSIDKYYAIKKWRVKRNMKLIKDYVADVILGRKP